LNSQTLILILREKVQAKSMFWILSFSLKLIRKTQNGTKLVSICWSSSRRKMSMLHSGQDCSNQKKKINTFKLIGLSGLMKMSKKKIPIKASGDSILPKCKVYDLLFKTLEEWAEWVEWVEWEDLVKVMKMMNKATWMICKRKKSWRVQNKRNKNKNHDANDVYLAIIHISLSKYLLFLSFQPSLFHIHRIFISELVEFICYSLHFDSW